MQSVLQLSIVVLQATGRGVVERTTLAADTFTLLSTLALLVLSYVEHSRTVRPSAIIQLSLFFTIVLDVPRLRTSWLLDGPSQNIVASLFTATVAVKVALLQLESFKKWTQVTMSPESIPPEEREGVFGRVFFWWLMPLFMAGYRRDLGMDDLSAIDDDLKGSVLYKRLMKSWDAGKKYAYS